jgi:hypothetical protein
MQKRSIKKPFWLTKENLMRAWIGLRRLPFYPLFISLYAILFFLHNNIVQVDVHAADRLLLVSSVLVLVLLAVLSLVMRNIWRAGMVTFALALIFYTYPHAKMILQGFSPVMEEYHLLTILYIFLLAGAIFLTVRNPDTKLAGLSIYLNMITLLLVIMQAGMILAYEFRMAAYWREARLQLPASSTAANPKSGSLPDVYFIVLDGYARADVLQEEFGLDNSGFIGSLRDRHFYVADCSMSNYAQTEQSLASTFNMMYLDGIISQISSSTLKEDDFKPYIENGLVRQYLESLGYQTVSFYSGYNWAQWPDATYFLGDPRVSRMRTTSLVPFESTFLSRTLFPYLVEGLQSLGLFTASQVNELAGRAADRAIVNYILDELPVLTELRGPKLVYAHVMLPHPPYVFGPNGEEQDLSSGSPTDAQLHQGYKDQVLYANKRILPIVDDILAQSKGNVIILLEGDHGSAQYRDPAQHIKNLNAYYLPDHDYSDLYATITPVNSFRVILTDYFGQDYPLLDDRSFYSAYSAEKNFEAIPNLCP